MLFTSSFFRILSIVFLLDSLPNIRAFFLSFLCDFFGPLPNGYVLSGTMVRWLSFHWPCGLRGKLTPLHHLMFTWMPLTSECLPPTSSFSWLHPDLSHCLLDMFIGMCVDFWKSICPNPSSVSSLRTFLRKRACHPHPDHSPATCAFLQIQTDS